MLVQLLEDRTTPTVTATFVAGVLTMRGDSQPDWESVDVSDRVYLNGTNLINQTGYPNGIPLVGITRIDLAGGDGGDTIDYRQSSTFRGGVRIFGENGNDNMRVTLLTNNSANITADGGAGRDTCDVPNMDNRIGSFWTNAELGAVYTKVGANVNRSSRVTPMITSDTGNRSPELLTRVIQQFGVATSPRYAPGGGLTYCNLFVWDVTSALGAEIPHWTYANGSIAQPYDYAHGASEMTANSTVLWLNTYGNGNGWTKVTASDAQSAANQGRPAVTIWKNPTGASGHMAVCVRDSSPFVASRGPAIAQAGIAGHNTEFTYVNQTFTSGFPNDTVEYWVHA